MESPDLSRIVETHVPVTVVDRDAYLGLLRESVLPAIRNLQAAGKLRWFSVLLHPAKQLLGFAPDDETPVIHIRLEPATGLDIDEFLLALPDHFEKPVLRPVSGIDGPDGSLLTGADWAEAWRLAGEASEFVLCALETHSSAIPPVQLAQFLHYITNALTLGGQFAYVPTGSRF